MDKGRFAAANEWEAYLAEEAGGENKTSEAARPEKALAAVAAQKTPAVV